MPEFRKYEIIGVANHHIFNLGEDYEVELVWTAGHAAGHAMFLDKKGCILFAGDDICSDISGIGGGPKENEPYGKFCNIETFRNQLVQLVERMDEFNYIFPSHFMNNIENNLLPNMLEACDAILADPMKYDYSVLHTSPNGGPSWPRMMKYIRGFSCIAYTERGIHPLPDALPGKYSI